ncbi:hypothetical protein QYE76_018842 [Lolium multiflorum]|uniref:F-box domain-containing protein n=1 Tax=Lolium multiflorum TaxID=4521 RepID=A0AAD8QGD0_LOLMU|nr:hypothetical protein QYE76_018842 [Lolium multiflorum]
MAASHRQGGDRLSALPDRALQHILSNLMSVEAVRTSVLSRRWRDVYETVPVVDLVDTKTGDRHRRSLGEIRICFAHQVASAILCKGAETPIRAFRLTMFHPPTDLLDQWISTALNCGVEDLELKHRYFQDETNTNMYHTPPQMFGCRTLRRLCLTNWTLDVPASVDMPSLETLCLVNISDSGRMLQLLLSSCPRLADLRLEECPGINDGIAVTSRYLRSFAMICCHDAAGVELQTTCLRSLHYQGDLPRSGSSFIVVANYLTVAAVRIGICQDLSGKGPREIAPVMRLIGRCKLLRYLDISLRPSMAYYSSLLTCVLRELPSLRQLGLHGCLLTDHTVRSIVALLLNTKDLEVLSLLPLAPNPKIPEDTTPLYLTDSDSDTEPEDSAPIRSRFPPPPVTPPAAGRPRSPGHPSLSLLLHRLLSPLRSSLFRRRRLSTLSLRDPLHRQRSPPAPPGGSAAHPNVCVVNRLLSRPRILQLDSAAQLHLRLHLRPIEASSSSTSARDAAGSGSVSAMSYYFDPSLFL